MLWGGADYSADCERTDLGTLVACGSQFDQDFDSNVDLDKMLPLTDYTFTAIINGIEMPQSNIEEVEDGTYVDFESECVGWAFTVFTSGGTSEFVRGEASGNPGKPCGRAIEYSPDIHIALYAKPKS